MNLKTLLLALSCVTTVFVSSQALAQEVEEAERQNGDVLSLARRPQQSPWETTVETTWLPASTIRDSGGDVSMGEVKAGFTRRVAISPRLELSTGLQYSLREIDAPASAQLPERLQTLSVHLGAEYQLKDALALGVRVSPGLSGDFRSVDGRDVRVPVAIHATYQASDRLSLLGGLAYTGQNRLPVLPVIGALYRPAEKWAIALGFPRTGVIYKPNRTTELFVAGEFSSGEYRLHDPSVGANIISYRDYRVLTGAEFRVASFLKLGVSGGYAFGRKFVFDEGNRSDVNLDGAPFARLEAKFLW
jgi:hypothetical protein